MSHRDFPRVVRAVDGKAVSAYRIACGKCGETCDCTQATTRPLAISVIERSFRLKGWKIGPTSRKDRCPACQVRAREADHDAPEPEALAVTPTPATTEAVMSNPVPPAVAGTAPRVMNFAERQLIYAKLSDVYVDETVGYSAGWTDARVATDMGVPRAWVETVRDSMFGPARDNPDIREFLDKLAEVQRECAVVAERAELAIAAANALSIRIKDLETLGKRVRQQTGL